MAASARLAAAMLVASVSAPLSALRGPSKLTLNSLVGLPKMPRRNATEAEADAAIAILERAIDAARNSNQAGENAVVRAAKAISHAPTQTARVAASLEV